MFSVTRQTLSQVLEFTSSMMKISHVVCGFLLLVWHPGTVFVQAESPTPPSATPTQTGATLAPTAPATSAATPVGTVKSTQSPGTSPGSSTTTVTSASTTVKSTTVTSTPTVSTSPPTTTAPTPATAPATTLPPPTTITPAPTTPTPAPATPPATPAPSTVTTTLASTVTVGTTSPSSPAPSATTTAAPTTPTRVPSSSTKTNTVTVPTASTATEGVATTTSPVATTRSSTTVSPTAPPTINVSISETNLLLADSNFFVELSGPANRSLSGITLVVVNATTNTLLKNVTFDARNILPTNGLYVHMLEDVTLQDTWKNLETALIFLCKPGNPSCWTKKKEQMDFIIASGSSEAAKNVSASIREMLDKPIIIANKEKLADMNITGNISLTRCGEENNITLIVSVGSMNAVNNCSFLTYHSDNTSGGMELEVVATGCMSWDDTIKSKLLDYIINKVNDECQCGLTSSLLGNPQWNPKEDQCTTSTKQEFKTNNLTGKFLGMSAAQISAFQDSYKDFVMTGPTITVGDQNFVVSNCSFLCVLRPPQLPSKGNDSINVTAAVVLSCIAVFLVILVAVVIYLRRQRRGVLQFRMTRLAEDDDLEDMEDFVGGPMDDHEPGFNNSHYDASG